MEAIGITGVSALLLVGAVAGFVELVKSLFAKEWRAAVIIVGSGLVGGLLSLFPEMDFSFLVGIVGGLAASGVITIGQSIAKNTNPTTVTVNNTDK